MQPGKTGEARENVRNQNAKQGQKDTILGELNAIKIVLLNSDTLEGKKTGTRLEKVIESIFEIFKGSEPGVKDHLDILYAEIKALGKKVDQTNKVQESQKPSYASVTAANRRGVNAPEVVAQQPPLKRKELKVTIREAEQANVCQGIPNDRLMKQLKRNNQVEAVKDLIAVRRLPSGDLAFHTATEEGRKQLEADPSWIKGITSSAEVTRQTFAVFVHGVKVSNINTEDQKQALRLLTEQNMPIHPGIEIIRTK